MTKLGFLMRGPVRSGTHAKRSKSRIFTGKVVARKSAIGSFNSENAALRHIFISTKPRASADVHTMSIPITKNIKRIKKLSSAESKEISFRQLNSLETHMKEEEFDVFE